MSSSAPPLALRGRLPGLDALRALAVILVLGYHLFPGLIPGGFIGVDVFFVVSGYLITALLLHERRRTGRIALRAFWARRARRLLPALALVVMSTATLASLIGGDVLVGMGWQLLGAATFTSNWVAISAGSSYLDQTSPELFRHLWSLAVEEQFYLLWPIAVIALLALPLRRWMLVALPLALAAWSALAMAAAAGDPALDGGAAASAAYLSTLTHGFGLLAGAALALGRDPLTQPRALLGRASTPVGVAAVAGVVAVALSTSIDDPGAYRGGMALAVALTVLAILSLERRESLAARVAESSPLVWVGERSYGLYLWHWPLWVLGLALVPGLDRTGSGAWGLGAAVLALSVLLAAVSYRFVELPIRRRELLAPARAAGGKREGAAVATVAVALALLVAGTGAALQRSPATSEAADLIAAGQLAVDTAEQPRSAGPSPSPSPDSVPATAPQPPTEPEPEPAPEPAPESDPAPEDTPAPLPTGDQIIAFGDSVMLAAAPALIDEFPGIAVDATVGRQMWSMPEVIEEAAAAGALRDVVIIGVGANGLISQSDLDRVIGAVRDRELVVVTASAPRGWIDESNTRLHETARAYRQVEVADWNATISGRLDLLAGDQVHPGPTGSTLYSAEIREALQRLADLPPLPPPPDPNRYDENPHWQRPV
ncbi:peptidoglycan/LPS O-acetylase OafA/YrhL [Microcella alkaliphila]|uniref:Peptidoglycan/LPS O-acetylase OafA/YrhL n=1 Tax=Microcella alkaliphila TaxID=279828 RepID=A0A4Q7TG47_9MICO|nr:acyltransferase family protein [Microcella alkaliphila]RZT58388.1 peptidoglycan/LPS O-acetylase OafA/YrhL [Microcella alkaliphila]